MISMLAYSCYYDVEEELYPSTGCETTNLSYSLDIVPILNNNCYSCHDQASNFGNITLEGYDNVLPLATDGRLLGAIKHESGFSPMPQNAAQLVACDIEKIETWIADGAPNN
jgi:hypothetical protein